MSERSLLLTCGPSDKPPVLFLLHRLLMLRFFMNEVICDVSRWRKGTGQKPCESAPRGTRAENCKRVLNKRSDLHSDSLLSYSAAETLAARARLAPSAAVQKPRPVVMGAPL